VGGRGGRGEVGGGRGGWGGGEGGGRDGLRWGGVGGEREKGGGGAWRGRLLRGGKSSRSSLGGRKREVPVSSALLEGGVSARSGYLLGKAGVWGPPSNLAGSGFTPCHNDEGRPPGLEPY